MRNQLGSTLCVLIVGFFGFSSYTSTHVEICRAIFYCILNTIFHPPSQTKFLTSNFPHFTELVCLHCFKLFLIKTCRMKLFSHCVLSNVFACNWFFDVVIVISWWGFGKQVACYRKLLDSFHGSISLFSFLNRFQSWHAAKVKTGIFE